VKNKITRPIIFFSILFLSWFPGTELSAQEIHLDVPFVPTPYEVIEDMLRFAELKKGDVLYDLGCGDGRIVIEAAKRAGIRAVGIDIDPQRIEESRENAKLVGVENLVEFRRQDIFEADFSEATVVTMYLLPSVNIRLRPKILSTLKPGTRIISHSFDMDDWQADRMTYVAVDLYAHTVYFWIVPANISGVWDWKMNLNKQNTNCHLEIEQKFQYFSGRLHLGELTIPIPESKIDGASIDFEVQVAGSNPLNLKFTGRTESEWITGTVVITAGGKNSKQAWKAIRRPGTSSQIDQ
jgi:SAM-dependent methyltransferase